MIKMILYQFLVSSFGLDANSFPHPLCLNNIIILSAFHVNKSSIKINMLSMIPYKL